ncbi:MAG: hypothetical protein AAFV36_07080 [Myxococcota bacterium]
MPIGTVFVPRKGFCHTVMVSGVIEEATSGRAKCRGCGAAIPKATLRFGERVPNPFGEGEATYWFHPWCAAARRPNVFLELETLPAELDGADELRVLAELGRDHHRLARVERVERAPSGRARCRECKQLIAKGDFRIALTIWEEGRFSPMGFIHVRCAGAYFGTLESVAERMRFAHSPLEPDEKESAILELS